MGEDAALQVGRRLVDLYVGKSVEFEDRGRKIIVHGDNEIGVFFVNGAFFAYENHCVHQGGPICQGQIRNKVIEPLAPDKTSLGLSYDEKTLHLICPWHGYEFAIDTGRHPAKATARLKSYPVNVRGDEVYVVV
jgi:nitrite reductase/ring-hydroxylating ferredoxin subunit